MAKPLRVLIVEDSEDDAELLLNQLRRGGYSPSFERVETAAGMRAALTNQQWDIVISDHAMPQFSSLAALAVLKESGLDLPFIIVSGEIGEDVAVEVMRSGAHDYVMKGKLARLVPAIERELQEAKVRRKRRLAEESLRKAHDELELRVRQRTAELNAIIDSITDGLVIYNLSGEIVRMNSAAEEILGIRQEQTEEPAARRAETATIEMADGKPCSAQDMATLKDLHGKAVHGLLLGIRGPDGAKVWLSASTAPIVNEFGEMLGDVLTFADVTRQHELQQQAEEAVKLRDVFLSVASHELKTPLTSLLGYSQVLRRQMDKTGNVDEERLRHVLRTIEQQSNKLANLINQLLDVSRIETGKLMLDCQAADISSIVHVAITDARQKGSQHKITLTTTGRLEALVDALRLEQVLANLLDNAIKYSPDSELIEVDVSAPGDKTVRIAVTDHGMGVPLAHREHIFDRFYQAERHYPLGGLGLGLFISKQIVELHDGTIEAQFPAEGGTRMVITLPTGPAAACEGGSMAEA